MSTKITYNGKTTELADGYIATLPCKDLKMETDVKIEAPEPAEISDSPLPIEVSTEAEMTALLTSGEVGGVYKYTGTTGTYENGALYVLEEEAEVEDELAGTWVFNDELTNMSDGDNWSLNVSCDNVNYASLWKGYIGDGYAIDLYKTTSQNWDDGMWVRLCTDWDEDNWEWFNPAYKTIIITSKLSEVTNGSTLLAWLKANATKQ